MNKKFTAILWFSIAAATFMVQTSYAKGFDDPIPSLGRLHTIKHVSSADSASARAEVMQIINKVINASSSFDINAVADLYTPNAVVADEEPPFSWNGPTAGVQWVSTVEKTCKDFKLKNFKARIGSVNVYLQTAESVYVVVPVDYTGQIKGDHFEEDGAFTFIFRMVSGHWLIKSQVWVARKGM